MGRGALIPTLFVVDVRAGFAVAALVLARRAVGLGRQARHPPASVRADSARGTDTGRRRRLTRWSTAVSALRSVARRGRGAGAGGGGVPARSTHPTRRTGGSTASAYSRHSDCTGHCRADGLGRAHRLTALREEVDLAGVLDARGVVAPVLTLGFTDFVPALDEFRAGAHASECPSPSLCIVRGVSLCISC